MTVVQSESGLGAGSERGEKERWKPYSNVLPGAKLGSLDMILKPDVGVGKGTGAWAGRGTPVWVTLDDILLSQPQFPLLCTSG